MKARVLPPEEWSRIEEGPLVSTLPYVQPKDTTVVVVEDEGRIVAHMAVLRVTHMEGLWVDPEHRNAGTERALMREAARALFERTPDEFAFACIGSELMREMVGRLGAQQIPLELWVMPVGRVN